MENNEKKPRVSTITLRLTNPMTFNVEVDYDCGSPYQARAMLNEAVHAIQRVISDAEAIEFNKKMVDANNAFRAMQKNPGHA